MALTAEQIDGQRNVSAVREAFGFALRPVGEPRTRVDDDYGRPGRESTATSEGRETRSISMSSRLCASAAWATRTSQDSR